MNESIHIMPILIVATVTLLVLYARKLESKKKKFTYRELTPDEILERNNKKSGKNIYGNRTSGHLDIDKFVRRRSP